MNQKKEEKSKLTSEYVRDYYDKAIGALEKDYSYFRWFDSDYSRFEFLQTERAILKVLGNRNFGRILEIGPGDGVWTKIFIGSCQRITALDISEEMIKRIKSKLGNRPNIDFI